MNVLIFGGGLQGLSCGSSLYKNHNVSIIAEGISCRHSKFFTRVFTGVKADETLYTLLGKEHFDVLIPVSDMVVPFISKNKSFIEDKYGVKCAVTDYEMVYQVENKSRFMDFCDVHNIPHPKTKKLSKENLSEAIDYVGLPALIKPDYSVGARGITRIDSVEELKNKFLSIYEKYGNCTLQELIDNQQYYYNVMLYRNSSGQILASAIIKIVRMYPITAGSSSCCISVENPELLRLCIDCLDKLNWVGMADFDVLQRMDNDEYKIIEINPRVPASLRGAAISGINFPEIIVSDVMGLETPSSPYYPGKVMRYMGLDIMWFLKSPNRFRTRPSWFNFFGKCIYYQDIYKHDKSTWWTWFADGIKKITQRKVKLR